MNPFPIATGVPLLVLSCSERKRPAHERQLVRFCDHYDGPIWQQVRASSFPMSNVAAISALYGFLEPGSQIKTYDHKMDDERSRFICTKSNHVWRLASAIEKAGAAFLVGGQLYRAVGEAAIRQRPSIGPLVTFATGSYLAQRKQLGAWLSERNARAAA